MKKIWVLFAVMLMPLVGVSHTRGQNCVSLITASSKTIGAIDCWCTALFYKSDSITCNGYIVIPPHDSCGSSFSWYTCIFEKEIDELFEGPLCLATPSGPAIDLSFTFGGLHVTLGPIQLQCTPSCGPQSAVPTGKKIKDYGTGPACPMLIRFADPDPEPAPGPKTGNPIPPSGPVTGNP